MGTVWGPRGPIIGGSLKIPLIGFSGGGRNTVDGSEIPFPTTVWMFLKNKR